jgi:hypothetical protein
VHQLKNNKYQLSCVEKSIMPNETSVTEQVAHAKNIARRFQIDFFSGLVSGTTCAVLFHPFDRAIYLSVKHNRSFFIRQNFSTPYHGVTQTIIQRAFLGSAYYFVQEQMKKYAGPYLKNELQAGETAQHIAIGFAAGSAHGLMTNTVSLVKAHAWSDPKHNFKSSAMEIYQAAGYKGFAKGMLASIARDTVYGCTYEVVRSNLQKPLAQLNGDCSLYFTEKHRIFLCNTTAACLSTILVSPLNHARTMKFSTPPNQIPPNYCRSIERGVG